VVAEAAILGSVASVGGVLFGILGALAITPWLDELTQRRNQPLVVDLGGLIAPAAIGLVAALIAAAVPARTAARVPVLVSLSGRRPAQAPAHRSLGIGLFAVAFSVGMTILGANLRLVGSDTLSVILMVGGAVLGTLGFGACGPWLLERLEGIAVRLPLSGRIAFRDTARARSRSSPIVTAVLASLAATVALGTWVVSRDQANAEQWQPYLYPTQLRLHGASAEAAGREVVAEDGAVAGVAVSNLTAPSPGYFWVEPVDARDEKGDLMNAPYGPGARPQFSEVAIATPDVLVIANAPGAAEAIAAGKVVVLTERPMTFDAVQFVMQDDPIAPEPSRRLPYDATVIDVSIVTGTIPSVLVPASIAADLALAPGPGQDFIVQLDRAVTDADVSQAAEVAAKYVDTFADAAIGPPRPDEAFRLLLIALALLFALSVTGVAIALGEAESRPEQRSLLALGADPRLRRRIAAARAGVLALLAGILAVPAGLLPVWGLLASREAPFVVPVPEIAGAVIALPLLAIAGAWLLTRPLPDWAAFRGVTTGQ
jgi:putative ABC transport system permease protein